MTPKIGQPVEIDPHQFPPDECWRGEVRGYTTVHHPNVNGGEPVALVVAWGGQHNGHHTWRLAHPDSLRSYFPDA